MESEHRQCFLSPGHGILVGDFRGERRGKSNRSALQACPYRVYYVLCVVRRVMFTWWCAVDATACEY